MCYQPESGSYSVPIYDLLNLENVRLIQEGRISELPHIFQSLSANVEDQKVALQNQIIILSPWELLCFVLFKSASEEI